jgi:hypothetical protein
LLFVVFNGGKLMATASRLFIVSIIYSVISGCNAPPVHEHGETEDEFTNGGGPLRGHEDVTRFGIDYANILLQREGRVTRFPAMPSGESCPSGHPIMHGNCATDSGDSTMRDTYGAGWLDWQTNANTQVLHFLRNHYGTSGVIPARSTCVLSRERIIGATVRAMDSYRAGSPGWGMYWLGHATHIIQDSFSAAHTRRTGSALRSLVDICSYDREVAGVCYHGMVDIRDRVWRDTLGCQLNPWDRSYSCLTTEAQRASLATAGYLRQVARYMEGGYRDDLTALLNAYFDRADDDYTGYHDCRSL